MIWQNPWAWAGLATLALPVLVHLFSRRQTRVVPFPSLRFVDVSRLLPTRRTQLSDVPLLLLRVLLLAVAVAALTQPLFERTRGGAAARTASAVARVLLIDSTAIARDAAGLAVVPSAVTERMNNAAHSLRLETTALRSELAGAAEWLSQHSGSGELLIVSDFSDGDIDSLDIAALPPTVAVQLVPLPERANTSTSLWSTSRAVRWATSLDAPTRGAITNAVRTLGGSALLDVTTTSATSQAAVSPGGSVRQSVIVASTDADSVANWLRSAAPLSQPWMGDVVLALHADTTLVTAMATLAMATSATPDSVGGDTVPAPFVVVNRGAGNAPIILAASLPTPNSSANDSTARLLLLSRAPASSLATAALLLAVSRGDDVAPHTADRTAPDDTQLQRWASAPRSAITSIDGRNDQQTRTGGASTDASTGPSDARWLWLVVVLLLVGETVLRRRMERSNERTNDSGVTTGSESRNVTDTAQAARG